MHEDHRWIPLPRRSHRLVAASIMVGLFVAAVGFAVWGRIRLDTWGEVFVPVKASSSVPPDTLQAALGINVAILITTALLLACGSLLAASVVRHRVARAYADFGLLAAATVIVAGVAADTLRLTLPASGIPAVWYGTPEDWEVALMVIVVSAEVIGWPIAIVGFGVTVSRALPMPKNAAGDVPTDVPLQREEMHVPVPLTKHDAKRLPLPAGTASAGGSWERGYNVPESPQVQRRRTENKPIVGICLSGGGVRAGSLALGVLQSTGMREKLTHADYLVSVSGGGYIAGAFQQALTDAGPDRDDDWTPVHEPETTLMSGTAEEDHVRRRASYVANTPAQLASALGRVAVHLVITLGLLFAPAVAVGIILGVVYANQLPLVPTHNVWEDVSKALPPNITWVGVAVLIPLAAAGLSLVLSRSGVFPGRLRRATKCFTLFAAATAVISIGIPVLIGLAKGIIDGPQTTGTVVTTSLTGTLAAYVISLISIGRKTTENLSKPPTWFNKVMKAPGAVINMILVVLIVIVIAAAWLLLLGGAAAATITSLHVGHTTLPIGPLVAAGIILVIALAVGVWVDETRLSLHPFYRARLASAFAVRRIRRGTVITAEEYDPTTETTLSTYGRRPGTPDAPTFPEVIFAASATIGGGRTPAGTNRVSYTFSGDWVGGPEVGYIATSALERFCPPAIARDVTVQSAVAISGAAISASGGGQGSPWYGTLFALSGVRLGSWLPNPAFVMERYSAGLDPETTARLPRIPRIRRIDYLVKELMGPHTFTSPMLQVTDGGFYDNLGLLELLRRRCTEIYAIDASGEVNTAPSTLARAISLAEQELGVRIDFGGTEIWNATAGSGDDHNLPEALTGFKGRLGSSPILVGTITYPAESGLTDLTGTIRVARASLWPDLPPDVIAYAFGHNAFPNDSTADQWFSDDDYRAYTTLGNKMGDRLAAPEAAGAAEAPAEEAGAPAEAPADAPAEEPDAAADAPADAPAEVPAEAVAVA